MDAFLEIAAGLVTLGFVGALLVGFLNRRAHPAAESIDELDVEARAAMNRVHRLSRELAEAIDGNAKAGLANLGAEIATWNQDLVSEAQTALRSRSRLRRALRGRAAALHELELLKTKLTAATSDAERDSLKTAISARDSEVNEYKPAEQMILQIDAGLEQTQAALSALKARVTAKPSTGSELDALRARLREAGPLAATLTEAADLVETGNLDL